MNAAFKNLDSPSSTAPTLSGHTGRDAPASNPQVRPERTKGWECPVVTDGGAAVKPEPNNTKDSQEEEATNPVETSYGVKRERGPECLKEREKEKEKAPSQRTLVKQRRDSHKENPCRRSQEAKNMEREM